jgi:hypothetical protein
MRKLKEWSEYYSAPLEREGLSLQVDGPVFQCLNFSCASSKTLVLKLSLLTPALYSAHQPMPLLEAPLGDLLNGNLNT